MTTISIDAQGATARLPETLTIDDVAAALAKPHQFVLDLVRRGALSAYPLGASWLVMREDLALFLQAFAAAA